MSPRVESVVLSEDQAGAVRAGRWVRVELGQYVELPIGRTRSALVGLARGAVMAWANACLHQPIPLDAVADPEEIAPGVRAAPMDDDRIHLLCHSHGALYRTRDGYCVSGPCMDQRLVALEVTDAGGTITVVLPIEE